ncbi:hypothetical protein TNCV_1409141 [Trichonephila clavipes]|uniref:Uncharacterized protein n=1 Tax=Trichonephila clavipes TaxID=2585209 RepID=A0A8X6UWI5_TRICX|nr:hypothetical protein TNCV_1409141 [Trichonephila clavipes]
MHSRWDPNAWIMEKKILELYLELVTETFKSAGPLASHLARMNEGRCCKKIFLAKTMENRPRGRPPLRWINCVESDLSILKEAKSIDAWRRLLENTRAHLGQLSH